MIRIEVSRASEAPLVLGSPIYVVGDYAFDYQPQGEVLGTADGTTSLLLGTLQIEVDLRTSSCLYAWGYSPWTRWSLEPVRLPKRVAGHLKVLTSEILHPGVSITVGPKVWKETFDQESGWFHASARDCPIEHPAIEFATETLAAVENEDLISIWIRPANWHNMRDLLSQVRSGR